MAKNQTTASEYQSGMTQFDLGNLKKALSCFESVSKTNKGNLDALVMQAFCLQGVGNFPASKALLDEVQSADSNHSFIHAAQGRLCHLMGEHEQAICEYKKQITRNSEHEFTRKWIQETYSALNKQNQTKRPSISACYIVKNEEDCLAESLKSIQGKVDEIIILDTGSTDGTVKIAEEFKAKVFLSEWRNDFAWARNQSLKHASSEWVLVLDADEVLGEQDWDKINDVVKLKDIDEISLIQTSYTDRSMLINWRVNDLNIPEAKNFSGYFESPLVRLFRNTNLIEFHGAVHENARHEKQVNKVLHSDIRIHHYGKNRDEERMKQKAELYHDIGLKKLKEMPDNAYAVYEMGVQLWELKKFDEVELYLKKAIAMDPKLEVAGIVYGCFLHHNERFADALDQFIRVAGLNSNNAEVHFYISSVLSETGNFNFAFAMLEKAQELGFSNEVSILVNKGVIHVGRLEFQLAREAYEKALLINDQSQLILINYAILEHQQGDDEQALELIHRLLQVECDHFTAHKLKGEILFGQGKREEALKLFLKAHSIFEYNDGVVGQIIMAAHSLGKMDVVKEYEVKLVSMKRSVRFSGIIEKLLNVYKSRNDEDGMQRLDSLVSSNSALSMK